MMEQQARQDAGDTRPDGGSTGAGSAERDARELPPIPRVAWIVRVLVPAGGLWRAEKRIRALEALPAVGDAIALDDATAARVEGVCSPAMSGVHADIYASAVE